MEATGKADLAKELGLEKFELNVQALERTFVDKVFALCDYHISKKLRRQSRHVYDLVQILPKIHLDDYRGGKTAEELKPFAYVSFNASDVYGRGKGSFLISLSSVRQLGINVLVKDYHDDEDVIILVPLRSISAPRRVKSRSWKRK